MIRRDHFKPQILTLHHIKILIIFTSFLRKARETVRLYLTPKSVTKNPILFFFCPKNKEQSPTRLFVFCSWLHSWRITLCLIMFKTVSITSQFTKILSRLRMSLLEVSG